MARSRLIWREDKFKNSSQRKDQEQFVGRDMRETVGPYSLSEESNCKDLKQLTPKSKVKKKPET